MEDKSLLAQPVAFPTVQAQPVYPQAQPVYPQPQPVYPQPQPVYPQPQPVYPQQHQGLVLTSELKDFFGYVKFIRIYSIIDIVASIIALPAIIFIWYPIIGLNVSRKWNESSFGCFYCWSWTNLVCGCLLTGYYLSLCFTGAVIDGVQVPGSAYISTFSSYFVGALLSYLVVCASTKIKKGLEKYQINDIMTKAAYTKLYIESNVPCKFK